MQGALAFQRIAFLLPALLREDRGVEGEHRVGIAQLDQALLEVDRPQAVPQIELRD